MIAHSPAKPTARAPAPAAAALAPVADSLADLFDRAAARWPDAVAVEDPERSLTYRGLAERADALAAELVRRGVVPGDRVGLLLGRSVHVVVSILAALKAGATYVPLDPDYPAQRLSFMLADSAVALVVGEPERIGTLDLGAAAVVDPRAGLQAGTTAGSRSDPHAPAYVIYTSGSTGRPKGCVVSHHNVLELLRHALPLFEVGLGDRWSLFHSCNFDFSVWELWGALASGGTVVVVPEAVAKSPADFLELVRRRRITVLNQVPSVFRYLAASHAEGGAPGLDLRYVVFGGESVDLDAVRDFLAALPGPSPTVVNMYGITEITVHATFKALSADDLSGAVRSPIGRPLPHLRIALLDEAGAPVPDGDAGEMWVSGSGLAQGYLNRPELTAQRFVVRDGVRYYRSGDLARALPSGELEYLGRNDAQVKRRGFRIELEEIEAALRSHPAVCDAGVAMVRNRHGVDLLVACYVATPGCGPSELRAHVGAALPGHMVPDRYVVVGALPLMPSGKLDRAALRDVADAGARRRASVGRAA